MPTQTSRVSVLVDMQIKTAFEYVCKANDVTPSQVLRRFMREYIGRHEAFLAARANSSEEHK